MAESIRSSLWAGMMHITERADPRVVEDPPVWELATHRKCFGFRRKEVPSKYIVIRFTLCFEGVHDL